MHGKQISVEKGDLNKWTVSLEIKLKTFANGYVYTQGRK